MSSSGSSVPLAEPLLVATHYPHSSLGLSPALAKALSGTAYSGAPYTCDYYELLPPGLRVHPIPEPISLPLTPVQAEQLVQVATVCPRGRGHESIVDESVRECLHIKAEAVSFENPAWSESLKEMMYEVCFDLAVPLEAVKYDLYKLHLYGPGGPYDGHADIEKTNGMFATCAVQLPSHVKGGELVFRQDGQEDTFPAGADNGDSSYRYYYSAFYADVDFEIRPVTEGYRLALIYKLSWVGEGVQPSAKAADLREVKDALLEHIESSPRKGWYVGFKLNHEYTEGCISDYGIQALKGVDRRNVGALRVAAQSLGIGELDFVLCTLDQVDDGCAFVHNFSPRLWYNTSRMFDIKECYCDDGEAFLGNLHWIDWSFLSYTKGNTRSEEGRRAFTMTTYHAIAVLAWARDDRVEAWYRSNMYQDMSGLLEDKELGPGPNDARADRLLSCLQTFREDRWTYEIYRHTRELLEFCSKHGLHEQMSRTTVFAATVPCRETGRFARILFQYVSKHGWDTVGDAAVEYLRFDQGTLGRYFEKPFEGKHYVEPLLVLCQVLPFMETSEGVTCFSETVNAIEDHCAICYQQNFHLPSCGVRVLGLERYWPKVFSVMAELEQRCEGLNDEADKARLDSIVTRISLIVGVLSEDDARGALVSLSRTVVSRHSHYVEKLLPLVKGRVATVSRERIEMKPGRFYRKKAEVEDVMRQDIAYIADFCLNPAHNMNAPPASSPSPAASESEGDNGILPRSREDLLDSFIGTQGNDIDALLCVVCELGTDPEEEQILAMLEEKVRRVKEEIDQELSHYR